MVWQGVLQSPLSLQLGVPGNPFAELVLLQEKVEVIRAKKPHIVEPVRLLTKLARRAVQKTRRVDFAA